MSLQTYDWQIAYGPSDDPLHSFYIPALQSSVRYDRSAGFFSSSALAIAAAGVAGLIQNKGTMRLLVGAELSDRDVQAIVKGNTIQDVVQQKLIKVLNQPVKEVMRQRWEVLAWMIANNTLEIKVVLPIDQRGVPVAHAVEYFHVKEGIFTDENGEQISFSGSINESMTAWQRNYEQFNVYRSWEASRPYHMQCVFRFDKLWNNKENYWMAFDIPEAAREALIHYAPSSAPEYDPLDKREQLTSRVAQEVEEKLRKERIIFQFLRDIPHMPGNTHLGAATSAIKPWPHQIRVSQRIIETYPHSYMLCDEVGLGKTIEAGLVLRQLVISGVINRCLLLVPRSVARQWQEELYEKFVLDIPLFDGKNFRNHAGDLLHAQHPDDNPWNQFDIFIATSQLAKRQERHEQLKNARSWDLIMVDEAHHARRKDFLQENYYRPNRLLDLLSDPKVRTQSILLMTATPMQVHPLEVWDLLKILGLGGKWGADGSNFLAFFTELRQGEFSDIAWDFVFDMVCDYLSTGGSIDPQFVAEGRTALGPVNWKKVGDLPCQPNPTNMIKRLPNSTQPFVRELERRHTPLRQYMFRNTRDLLREYVAQGLLDANVPNRVPEPVWIPMRAEEQDLYERIEEYISQFYRKYEAKRSGLGFVMTVYRRRLTSSFYAVRKSLERRLEFLEGQLQNGSWATDEDLEQEELTGDINEELNEVESGFYQEEVDYVRDFLNQLDQLSAYDSKTEQLVTDMGRLFRTHNTVLVFTQYTDTMDYLRAKLLDVYANQVACYSGRGGEVWNGIAWVEVPKEDIKQKFRRGDEVKILLCTEAASEGLNLQTCGVLINYDMPWNPMRVEQRIGRIDRIGQVHDTVYIRNYFYEDTIEARVYQALSTRIDWFENVVGNLQPILARVGRVIEQLVMTSPDEREARFKEAIAELEGSITEQNEQDVMDVYQGTEIVHHDIEISAPVTLEQLESILIQSHHLERQFRLHSEIDQAFILTNGENQLGSVTFQPDVFDTHPNSLQLMSYGNQLFHQILNMVDAPQKTNGKGVLRVSTNKPIPQVGFYSIIANGKPKRILTVNELLDTIDNISSDWSEQSITEAITDFTSAVSDLQTRLRTNVEIYRRGISISIAEQTKVVLGRAALVEIAMSQIQDHSLQNTQPLSFGDQSVLNLERHGKPFRHLLHFLNGNIQAPKPTNAYYQHIIGMSNEQLKREFRRISSQAADLLNYLMDFQKSQETTFEETGRVVSEFLV
jgi:ERCC4-related helicase